MNKKHLILLFLLIIFLPVLTFICRRYYQIYRFLDPAEITFAGHDYLVFYKKEFGFSNFGVFIKDKNKNEAPVQLSENCHLLVWDFNNDGKNDIGTFTNSYDGFRNTFYYMDFYLNKSQLLSEMKPVEGKFKEEHWVWVDFEKYPALTGIRHELGGLKWVMEGVPNGCESKHTIASDFDLICKLPLPYFLYIPSCW